MLETIFHLLKFQLSFWSSLFSPEFFPPIFPGKENRNIKNKLKKKKIDNKFPKPFFLSLITFIYKMTLDFFGVINFINSLNHF